MIGWIKHLRQKWNDWCGDREMELAIRQQLNDEGFFGSTANLQNVRLVAIQRPGWLQIYRFEAMARLRPEDAAEDAPDEQAQYIHLFGLVKDDIRFNINTVKIFRNSVQRRALFADWSQDLIRLRGAEGLL